VRGDRREMSGGSSRRSVRRVRNGAHRIWCRVPRGSAGWSERCRARPPARGTEGTRGRSTPRARAGCDPRRHEQGGRHGGGGPCASGDLLSNPTADPEDANAVPHQVGGVAGGLTRSIGLMALSGVCRRSAVADSARPASPMCRWSRHLLTRLSVTAQSTVLHPSVLVEVAGHVDDEVEGVLGGRPAR
jgi:hypothetical protein